MTDEYFKAWNREETKMDREKNEIKETCEDFLADWHHGDWKAAYSDYENGEDYLEGGILDPDNVKSTAKKLGVGDRWQGLDGNEGWDAYRCGNDLYLNWWRTLYLYSSRHRCELWVLVSGGYFAA